MSKLVNDLVYLPLGTIKRISPSGFSQFQHCSLREIWSLNRHSPLLPSHPSAKLGTIIHAVLEASAKGAVMDRNSFERLWDEIIKKVQGDMLQNEVEKHLVPLETFAFNYEVKKILCFKMTEHIFDSSASEVPGMSSVEQWFESADGKIRGKIDLILTHADYIEIVDYKTGNVLDSQSSGEVKDEYKIQMKLYAGLYHERTGNWPGKLSLIGIDRKKYYVSFGEEECLELLNKARKTIDETNELIEAGRKPEDFAHPSPVVCKHCSYRPACMKYWLSKEDSGQWPCDVIGEVKEKSLLGNGYFRIVINGSDKVYVIRGLSDKRYKFLNEDSKGVLFCNLGQDLLEGHYTEQLLTTGYLLNNETKKA